MDETSANSKIVGTTLKIIADNTKLIPLEPRSIVFDKAPVCLPKWNAKSKLCKCVKTLLAIRLIDCCATLANTAFLNSLKPAAPARAIPSTKNIQLEKSYKLEKYIYLWD